jgi:Uma2 family endonuclease
MAEPSVLPDRTMSREEFFAWAAQQPRGRFERIGGRVVAMSPERFGHVRAKTAVWAALRDAIAAAGADCEAVGDGVTVSVDADTDYEPDVLVNCGEPAGDEAIVAPNPVVVVEVVSPSSKAVDTGAKFMDYFRVASIRHYLILRTDQRMVVHHRRRDDGVIESRLLGNGPIALDPPGIVLQAESFFAR